MPDELRQVCAQQFSQHYRATPQRFFFSPGRINIIGEHLDYNGGLVLPCAINLGTAVAVAPHPQKRLRLYSHNFPELAPKVFSLENISYHREQGWCNYVLGMVDVLQQAGLELEHGFDMVFYGNLPTGGSGLSSSASLEVLVGWILLCYSGFPLSRENLAVLAQRAENEFCGLHCGIMDQFIIAMAQAHCAALLDCATLKYEQIPLELGQHAFIIADTRLPRKLQESKYNERREECQAALAALEAELEEGREVPHNLCRIGEAELPKVLLEILGQQENSEVLQRRTRHVVRENARTYRAAAAMKNGNWAELGSLLSASHASLRDDYEVSGDHLDYLVALLQDIPEVLGARMTGAGFGGCSIALVDLSGDGSKGHSLLQEIRRRIAPLYQERFSWVPEFYLSEAGPGVREL